MSKHLFENAMAPRRESRVRSCIAYGGNPAGIVKKERLTCTDPGQRSFSQGSICLLLPALGTLASLPETAVLLHGAVGCGSSCHAATANSRSGSAARWGEAKDTLWMSTSMGEIDVVSGGERKLAEAIEEVDRRHNPKVILVVSGCVPGITGDDVEAVTTEAQLKVRARVVPVHCEGFRTKLWATAYDAYYHAFGRHLFEPPDSAPPVDPAVLQKTVNLLNVSSMGRTDELELIRLLNALGLQVNVFPVFSKPDEMYKVTRAALSISTCPTHDDYLLGHLEEKYGIPSVLAHMPIGIASTGKWLRDVAKHFHQEELAEQIIAREEAALQQALAPLLPALQGKRAFLSAGEFRALATATLLAELGCQIVAIRPFHHDRFAEVELEKLKEHNHDFVLNVANCQPFEEANLIARTKPDLFLGHLVGNSTASKLGVATHTIYHVGLNYVGYRGAFELARRLNRQLRNPAFHRQLAQNLKLPYTDRWMASDPFSHIRSDTNPGTTRDE